jgi:hypothetical protein
MFIRILYRRNLTAEQVDFVLLILSNLGLPQVISNGRVNYARLVQVGLPDFSAGELIHHKVVE